jgi:hypothetical protein
MVSGGVAMKEWWDMVDGQSFRLVSEGFNVQKRFFKATIFQELYKSAKTVNIEIICF